jgi:hypothetical protein
MLPSEIQDYLARESSSSMNVTIEKEHPAKKKNSNKSPRIRINENIAKKLAKYSNSSNNPFITSTSESTCETSGVSMNCSFDFSSTEIETGTESKSFSGHMTSTKSTSGTKSGRSLLPSSVSGDSVKTSQSGDNEEEDVIHYFGYGPIVNHFVRIRRGVTIPPEDIQTAILYDHRLQFVPGGTANIVPKIGWDVKGVILKFKTQQEWETFRQFDASYEVRPVSVSIIDKTNIDPKNKNDHTSPFEGDDYGDDDDDEDYDYGLNDHGNDQQQQVEQDDKGFNTSERAGPLVRTHRLHKSCLVTSGANSSLNNLDGMDSSDEDDNSLPFSFEPKSKKADPKAIQCYTFAMDWTSPNKNRQAVFGKPQERYLKLMTDGLRYHEIDETYIRDEILAVDYIPNERDKVSDQNSFLSFPNAKKVSKFSQQKYETKLCGEPKTCSKDNKTGTHFVIGTKIMRVDGDNLQLNNPCVKWLRKQAHGMGDITLLVHQTFVDKDQPFHIPLLDNPDDVTEQHHKWAEHVVYLYLERGGLTATTIGELVPDNGDGGGGKSFHFKGLFKKGKNQQQQQPKTQRASFPHADLHSSLSNLHEDGSASASFHVSPPASNPTSGGLKSKFGGKLGRFHKKANKGA